MVNSNGRWFIIYHSELHWKGGKGNLIKRWKGEGVWRTDFNLQRSDGLYLGRNTGTEKDVSLLRGVSLKIFLTVNVSKHMNSLVLHGKPSLNFWEKQLPREVLYRILPLKSSLKMRVLYTSFFLLSPCPHVSGIFAFSTPAPGLASGHLKTYIMYKYNVPLYYSFFFYR